MTQSKTFYKNQNLSENATEEKEKSDKGTFASKLSVNAVANIRIGTKLKHPTPNWREYDR